jgi:hypothetical protein
MTDTLAAERPSDAAPEEAPEAAPSLRWWQRFLSMPAEGWITLGVVLVSVGFTLSHLQPHLLIADTTPAGGDMGAHVWGPAYLRDHLLPHGRVTGWTPDWYAGFPAYQFYMVVPSLMILLLDVVLPYGVAFKLITVSGVLTLPVAAWAFGRLSGLRFPGPAMLAAATVPFLFDTGFTIYGGNIASTLAGEFAFSISLSVAMVYLGVVARGLETGKHRALAAALLALCGLCHLIPAFFALAGTAIWLLLRVGRVQLKWVLTMLPVAGMLAAFWVLPFFLRRAYVNDMGWEKLTEYRVNLIPVDNRWLFVFPIVGAIFAIVRRSRTGIWLTISVAVFAFAFVVAPQGRLWNARLLPFYFLCLYLLGGYAIAEGGKALGRLVDVGAPGGGRGVRMLTPVVGLTFVLVLVALPLHALPFGDTGSDGVYRWFGLHTTERSFVDGWARWNYSGYERKLANASGGGYTEYFALMQTMGQVGEDEGCGRAMWEYERELDRYGTPMALMLLPHWTDGCIGSMEGLYFEASSTTPYHFLNQSELSTAPSRAQRDLPYRNFDLDAGIQHLQLLGVRYYLAFSDQAVEAADQHPDLTPITTSGPWHVYEVADSELVTPLRNQPAVLDDVTDAIHSWLPASVDWYQDPSQWDVPLASSGPDEWQRIDQGENPDRIPVDPVDVSAIESDDDSISFDVDQVGSPVLVKASYFPNWQASGAEGPWRVTPNLMVVIPTDTHVELHYGYTDVDYLAYFLTLLGIIGVVWLARRPPLPVPVPPPRSTDEPSSGPGEDDSYGVPFGGPTDEWPPDDWPPGGTPFGGGSGGHGPTGAEPPAAPPLDDQAPGAGPWPPDRPGEAAGVGAGES